MRLTRKLMKNGTALYLPITREIREHLGIDMNNEEDFVVEWQDENKSHGPFISFWKKKKEDEQEEKVEE